MRIDLYNEDCLKVMPKLSGHSVDMVLADLPYGTTRNGWDRQISLRILWVEYERIIKDRGVILLFAQLPFDKQLAMSNLKLLRYEWIWVKSQGTGFLNAKKMPLKRHETVLVFYKHLPKYNPQMEEGKPYICKNGRGSKSYDKQKQVITICNGLRYPSSILSFGTEKKYHPTQKPVALCEYLVKTYTDAGDTVLDNCMGSGTTGVACKNLDRNFIGIESDPHYFEIAKRRINGE